MEHGLLFLPNIPLERQAAQRRPLLDQLLGVQPAEVEVLPPLGLFFPPVVVEETLQQTPCRSFLLRTLGEQLF